MNKSIKQNVKKNKNKNKTLKNKNLKDKQKNCMSGLKPFEFRYQHKKHRRTRQQEIDVFKKKLTRFISPTNVTPQNDFYTYINYYWLKKASLNEEQRYITQIDDFRLTQDKVYYDLKEIVLDYIKSNNNKLSHQLKTFYNSVVNMNSLKHSNEIVKEIIHKIDEIRKEKTVYGNY